jgi:hypothetical protein
VASPLWRVRRAVAVFIPRVGAAVDAQRRAAFSRQAGPIHPYEGIVPEKRCEFAKVAQKRQTARLEKTLSPN